MSFSDNISTLKIPKAIYYLQIYEQHDKIETASTNGYRRAI